MLTKRRAVSVAGIVLPLLLAITAVILCVLGIYAGAKKHRAEQARGRQQIEERRASRRLSNGLPDWWGVKADVRGLEGGVVPAAGGGIQPAMVLAAPAASQKLHTMRKTLR
ncbi:hypothetical protein K470DRAFT_273162 [Piedraia hortae CBS 480.64]|uniref:Uncharacterized protein n=1 Tax=Piedraia hortae CBS 480.64 TaxID=1314780 RepID=A0A6A7BST8_9PEZI|nr:hypothetical protein K470DRAFT_273162 [Piedraia hortae CBS 480.64]